MCDSVQNVSNTTTSAPDHATSYPIWPKFLTNNVSQAIKTTIYSSNSNIAQIGV